MTSPTRALATMLALAGTAAGCSTATAVCVVGEAVRCTCADGREGVSECDRLGQPGACACDQLGPGEAAWSRTLGNDREQSLIALAAGPNGVVVVGAYDGSLEVGGFPLESAGARDIFVASFDPGGAHRWSRSYGGPDDDFALAVAIGTSGEVYVAGGFSDELRLVADEPIILTSEGGTDAFVMRIDAMGQVQWARSWGSLGFDAFRRIRHLPGDPEGSLYLGGYFQLTLSYKGGVLAPSGGTDVMTARVFAAGGDEAFFTRVGGGGDDALGGIATLGGQFYAAGGYQGFSMVLPNSPEGSVFVQRASGDGTVDAIRVTSGAGRDDARAVAVANDWAWIAGRFQGQLAANSSTTALEAVGGQDIFLTRLEDNGLGAIQTFGDGGSEEVTTLESDGASLLMAGGFDGTLDFGLGALVAAGPGDGYAVRMDGSSGAPIEQVLISSTGFAQVESAAFDLNTDRWWLAGRYEGTLTIGEQTHVSQGHTDFFVAAVRPP